MNLYIKQCLRTRFLLVALIPFVLIALLGCGGSSSNDSAASSPSTTVLVYMIGTDLESADGQASGNIQEMMAVGSGGNLNIVVQTGGANKSATPGAPQGSVESINWKNIQRYFVQKGSIALAPNGDLGPDDASSPSRDMGNQTTLNEFLQWGVTNYPAQNYIVVLWSHGGGVNYGIGADTITEHSISTAQISNAIQQVSTDKKIQFKIVGFDACLMATAEVASSLIGSTQYMIASQDVEPGGSWAYKEFLTYLTQNPSASGIGVGTNIVDTYLTKMKEDSVTLSVTDISKVSQVIAATNDFAALLSPFTQRVDSWKHIAQARALSIDWNTSAIFYSIFDLVDFRDFARNVSTYLGDASLIKASDKLESAIDAAVVYHKENGSNMDATGLTVYFPSILGAYEGSKYSSNTTKGSTPFFASNYTDGLTGLIASYYSFYKANTVGLSAVVTLDDPQVPESPYGATVNNDYDFILAAHIRNDCSFVKLNASNEYQSLETLECADAMNGNDVVENRLTKKISFPLNGKWSQMSDGVNVYPVPLVPDQGVINKTGKSNGYLVPAYLVEGKKYTQGYLVVDDNGAGIFKVLGFQTISTTAGKIGSLAKDEKYSLGAYSTAGTIFRPTNKVLTVGESKTLTLSFGAISSGFFAYVITDLTGAVSSSGNTTYPQP